MKITVLSACLLLLFACNNDEPRRLDDVDLIVDDQDGNPPAGDGEDPGKAAEGCYPAFADNELNVATWNIENFPMEGQTTINGVTQIVQDLDADIIAVQEIRDIGAFNLLFDAIDGWESTVENLSASQDIGYAYKVDAFSSVSTTSTLFDNDSYGFPREAVVMKFEHVNGMAVTLINIHLKCCGNDFSDEYRRRESASEDLENYIEQNLDNEMVILLGDFNDEIGVTNTPFQNFIDNPDFRFATQSIAEGPESNWSYPSWASHLDHIVISNELFDKVGVVQTIKPESCVSNYSRDVSDHRPVIASFSNN